MTDAMIAQRINLGGQVQGVGFRPFVCRLARRFGLAGEVSNDGHGVRVLAQGASQQLDRFQQALTRELPPLAQVDHFQVTEVVVDPLLSGFEITVSESGELDVAVTPDASVCRDCLRELFDPGDRRYAYPFINCTNCGPRYTLVKKLPYDRAGTTMASFRLCRPCEQEYRAEDNRRFHAQPTACADCGPELELRDGDGGRLQCDDPLGETLRRLQAGEILAIKGIGGFHLVCDARNSDSVAELRRRKHRPQKPFALMAAGLPSLEPLVELNDTLRQRLQATDAPVVLCRALGTELPGIAPGLDCYGVMLPHSPLHYLLFHRAAGSPRGIAWLDQPQQLLLLMTSANRSGNPLVTGNQQALRELSGIADAFLMHNRDIHSRCDDSVVNGLQQPPALIRSGRGLAPRVIRLAQSGPSVLACGGFFKNTICLTRGDRAYISPYIGDLDNPACCRTFSETVDHLQRLLEIEPERVAVDLHKEFHSSRYGADYAGRRQLPLIGVQHHHAHIAAVIAEHQISEPVLGLALDGLGLGSDNGLWGGELLQVSSEGFRRAGYLRPLPLPGGDRAAREPWRMAAGVLFELGRADEIESRFAQTEGAGVLQQMLQRRLNCPLTSSAGRLFDAAAGLLGVQLRADYEAQPAMLLESLARRYLRAHPLPTEPLLIGVENSLDKAGLDTLPLLARLSEISEPAYGAALLHQQLIVGLSQWAAEHCRRLQLGTLVLGGGCFLNQLLSAGVRQQLQAAGLRVFQADRLPCNDGGLSLGQAAVAQLQQLSSGNAVALTVNPQE